MNKNKLYWVKKLLSTDTLNRFSKYSKADLIKEWFSGATVSDSLRLTDSGKAAFEQYFTGYDFRIALNTKSSYTNALIYFKISKKLTVPYYISVNGPETIITIYDEQAAVYISLSGGIQEFLGK